MFIENLPQFVPAVPARCRQHSLWHPSLLAPCFRCFLRELPLQKHVACGSVATRSLPAKLYLICSMCRIASTCQLSCRRHGECQQCTIDLRAGRQPLGHTQFPNFLQLYCTSNHYTSSCVPVTIILYYKLYIISGAGARSASTAPSTCARRVMAAGASSGTRSPAMWAPPTSASICLRSPTPTGAITHHYLSMTIIVSAVGAGLCICSRFDYHTPCSDPLLTLFLSAFFIISTVTSVHIATCTASAACAQCAQAARLRILENAHPSLSAH